MHAPTRNGAPSSADAGGGAPAESSANGVAGFTLLELVAALALLGVLAALVVSAYQVRLVRDQIADGLASARPWQAAVERSWLALGDVPPGDAEAGVAGTEPASPYVESVAVADGHIELVFSGEAAGAIAGRRLVLSAWDDGSAVVWVCGAGEPPEAAQPVSPRPAAAPASAGIDPRFLPDDCR